MPKTYYSLTSSNLSFIAVVTKSKETVHIHISDPSQLHGNAHLEVMGSVVYIHSFIHFIQTAPSSCLKHRLS